MIAEPDVILVTGAAAGGVGGVFANTSEVKASHVAFISHLDVVAKLIEQAAAAAAK